MSSATIPNEPGMTLQRRRPVGAAILGAYAGVVYLFFLAVLCYAIGFFGGFGVPKTIDDGPSAPVPLAVCIDLLLLTVFAGQHTVMARPWFKRVWTRIVPTAAERATFVLATNLVLTLLFWLWRPIEGTVWHLHGAAAVPLEVTYATGWLIAIGSTYLISHADLFGLRQAWLRMRGVPYRPPAFTERGLYRHVRHPLMAGFVIVFWSTPVMSAGHLLFVAAATGYILVGIAFEEHDLIRSLGDSYLAYRARVPALIPISRRFSK
jgi:protein-S-isoprenylcysteine O-methyltransferase Ste14